MKLLTLLVTLASLLLFACEEDEPTPPSPSSSKELTTFSILAEHNPGRLTEDLVFSVQDTIINAMFPVGQARDSLIVSFGTTAMTVWVDSALQFSDTTANDFTQPLVYTLMAEDSSIAQYTIRPHTYSGLPVVYVNTEAQAPIASKEEYIDAQVSMIANELGEQKIDQVPIRIRGRGNTTWQMPKKPYKFKFDERTEVLNMPAHKTWILLANYPDKTLLRNQTAFSLSERFGLFYTPRSQFVDLYLNDSYQGNYQLTEQIKIDENRLAIDELEPTELAEDLISGGYLLEVDGRSDPDPSFTTEQGIRFKIKFPDEGPDEQLSYIQNYIRETESALFSASFADPQSGYDQYIDVESFVNWYLVNELAKNTDAKFYNSVYMYKPRNGKLTMGPVWDYDIGFGNVNYSDGQYPEGWYIREAAWYKRLFEDPDFVIRVKNRWQTLKPEVQATIEEIDAQAAALSQSQRRNFSTWKILNRAVWPNPVTTGSYQGEVDYLKDWLNKRIIWMDQELTAN